MRSLDEGQSCYKSAVTCVLWQAVGWAAVFGSFAVTDTHVLAGVDLAWQCTNNPTAIAVGSLDSAGLVVSCVSPAIYGVDEVLRCLLSINGLSGVAIDAPLIINNRSGQRVCEREIAITYGSRKACCHASNTRLYPDADSVAVSNRLSSAGFSHLDGGQWQIECYPHPALIELFSLKERLKYKKGRVQDKKAGQVKLARLIAQLDMSPVLRLIIEDRAAMYCDPKYIDSLKGQALKSNEDSLDAIVCLYIAALHAVDETGHVFGNVTDGYIWVPQCVCI